MTSKGLEMLEIIKQRNDTLKINHKIGSRDIANQEIKEITQCFDNYVIPVIEKELKALEIIKTKRVDIPMFYEIVSTVDKMFARDRYNQDTNEEILTQEEFDLLKEVLEDE